MAEIGHQAKIPSLAEDWSLVEKDELPDHSNTFEEGTIKDNSTATASREISPDKIDQAPILENIVHTKGENVEESKVEEQPTKVEEKHAIENAPIVEDNSAIPEQKKEPQEVEQNEPLENSPTAEENSETPIQEEEQDEEGKEEAKEEAPVIKIETAPADFRFPTTNQSRHCFTRYIEYHRCIAAKGEDAPECQKFAKYYRSLCPGEWIERWNEQRANGTFPGPL